MPYGIVTGHGRIFTAHALLPGAVVALLPGMVACTVKSEAPGRIPRSLLSILASTEPAVGAILGLIALGAAHHRPATGRHAGRRRASTGATPISRPHPLPRSAQFRGRKLGDGR